jgi:hypothetical protein
MTLKSALDDVLGATFAAVPGVVGKLNYVAGLREGESYSHWGLTRVYGQAAAQQALADAHRAVFLETLRTSLRTLRADVEVSSGGLQSGEYVNNLREKLAALLPQDLGGGTARHLNLVLRVLSSLLSHPAKTPGATPPV